MGVFDNFNFLGAIADALGNAGADASGFGMMPSVTPGSTYQDSVNPSANPPPSPPPPPDRISSSNDRSLTDPYPLNIPDPPAPPAGSPNPASAPTPPPAPLPPILPNAPNPRGPAGVPGGDMMFGGPPAGAAAAPAAVPMPHDLGAAAIPGGPTAAIPPQGMPLLRPPGGALPPGAGPFLANIFGKDPRLVQQNVASLAAGLKSVGNNWNKPGAAAFAAGLGSALSGGQGGDRAYYNDWLSALKAQAKDDNEKTRLAAQQAKDAAKLKVGTSGQRQVAWANSEIGRYDQAMMRYRQDFAEQRKAVQKGLNSENPEDHDKAQKYLDDWAKENKPKYLRRYGLDPDKENNYQNRGQPVYKDDGNVDVDKTTEQAHRPKSWVDYNATVKPGDWFINPKTGQLRQRDSSVPPPADDPRSPLAQIPDSPAPENDDEKAIG